MVENKEQNTQHKQQVRILLEALFNIAEWRSWSSRLAHNQEVAQSGSNPASATHKKNLLSSM